MKYAAVNGSPRGKKSNSDRIIGWIFDESDMFDKVYIAQRKRWDESLEKAAAADTLLIVFPLYTDCMPGLAKAFLEDLEKKDLAGKNVAFVIHCGFPEAIHLRALEKFCEYYAEICNMNYLGCVAMGGSEALQMAPDQFFGRRFKAYSVIKQNILKGEKLDSAALKTIAGTERLKKFRILFSKIMHTDFYWNRSLKKNGAFDRRFDRPYE